MPCTLHRYKPIQTLCHQASHSSITAVSTTSAHLPCPPCTSLRVCPKSDVGHTHAPAFVTKSDEDRDDRVRLHDACEHLDPVGTTRRGVEGKNLHLWVHMSPCVPVLIRTHVVVLKLRPIHPSKESKRRERKNLFASSDPNPTKKASISICTAHANNFFESKFYRANQASFWQFCERYVRSSAQPYTCQCPHGTQHKVDIVASTAGIVTLVKLNLWSLVTPVALGF